MNKRIFSSLKNTEDQTSKQKQTKQKVSQPEVFPVDHEVTIFDHGVFKEDKEQSTPQKLAHGLHAPRHRNGA